MSCSVYSALLPAVVNVLTEQWHKLDSTEIQKYLSLSDCFGMRLHGRSSQRTDTWVSHHDSNSLQQQRVSKVVHFVLLDKKSAGTGEDKSTRHQLISGGIFRFVFELGHNFSPTIRSGWINTLIKFNDNEVIWSSSPGQQASRPSGA